MASTWGDIIADALREITVYNPIDTLQAEDLGQGVRRLNRILDMYAARRVWAYTTTFTEYTLTPNHQPTLIGPGLTSPDFATVNAAPRPVRLESCNLVLTDVTPNVDVPMNIRDAAWWASQRVKGISTDIPTDVYYEPDFPSGSLYFWPVPSFAYGVRLETWIEVGQFPLTSEGVPNPKAAFSAPPAYELAIVLTLAEYSAVPYGKPLSADLRENARQARAAVEGNNNVSPRIASADYGTRGRPATRPRGDFNYYSGMPD